jgi:DUF4097 and DUF4098 domain-containing protein YvlB
MGILTRSLPLALLISVCAFADEWTKTFPVSGNPEIRVETEDGSVMVRVWDEHRITAHVTTSGWRIAPGEIAVQEYQTGDRVRLVVTQPHRNFNFSLGNRRIRIDLQVPRQIASDIRTGDGSISIEDVVGDTRLHTGDGRIDATSVRGSLRAETGDGHISVRGRLEMLMLHSGDGAIEAEVSEGSRMGGSWNVETGDGHVTLRLPRNFAANLDANSGDGAISVDLPSTSPYGDRQRNHVRAAINGGGPTFSIRSGDGAINVSGL